MKKLGIGIMMLMAVGCGKDDLIKTETPTPSMTVEYLSVNETHVESDSKSLTDTTIRSYVDVTVKYNKEVVAGTLGALNSANSRVKRVAVLGIDSLIYGYVDVIEISPKIYEASYYYFNGKLYMKAILKNDTIKITETYFDTLSGAKPRGWFGRFANCVEQFAYTVSSDPEWGAVFLVGAYTAPHYVLAGLGIGCGIHASMN
ncbi:MAG: hypothetical protein K9G46_01010 [Flavobacteriales bacterium]|nr:hypothetical protein [Flavobacteriales bacterium]